MASLQRDTHHLCVLIICTCLLRMARLLWLYSISIQRTQTRIVLRLHRMLSSGAKCSNIQAFFASSMQLRCVYVLVLRLPTDIIISAEKGYYCWLVNTSTTILNRFLDWQWFLSCNRGLYPCRVYRFNAYSSAADSQLFFRCLGSSAIVLNAYGG